MASEKTSNLKLWLLLIPVFALVTGGFIYLTANHDQPAAQAQSSKNPFGIPAAQTPGAPQPQQPTMAAQIKPAQQQTSLPGVLQTANAKVQSAVSPEAPRTSMMAFYGGQDVPATPQQNTKAAVNQPPTDAVLKTLSKWETACTGGRGITVSALQMLKSPMLLKAFINDKLIVKLFMKRFKKEAVYNNSLSLIAYAKTSPELDAVLTNETLQGSLEDTDFLSLLVGSELTSALAKAPSIAFITEKPALMKKLLKQNAKLSALLTNRNMNAALAANPDTEALAKAVMANASSDQPDPDQTIQQIKKLQTTGGPQSSDQSGGANAQDMQKMMQTMQQQGGGQQQSQHGGSSQQSSFPKLQPH